LWFVVIAWIGLVKLRPEMGLVEAYIYLAALVGLIGGGWCLGQRRSTHRGSDIACWLLVVWLASTLLVGFLLPAIGYLFVRPAIAAGIAEMMIGRNHSYSARLIAVSGVALATFVVLVTAIDIFFQFASPRPGSPGSERPATIAASLSLVFLVIGLHNVIGSGQSQRD
jgi:hypothetical protein